VGLKLGYLGWLTVVDVLLLCPIAQLILAWQNLADVEWNDQNHSQPNPSDLQTCSHTFEFPSFLAEELLNCASIVEKSGEQAVIM